MCYCPNVLTAADPVMTIQGRLQPLPSTEFGSAAGWDIYVNADLVAQAISPSGHFNFAIPAGLKEGLITVRQRYNSLSHNANEKVWQYDPMVFKIDGQSVKYRRAILDKQYPSPVDLKDPASAPSNNNLFIDQMYSEQLELPLSPAVVTMFQTRDSFSILQMLKSPMVIMMLVTLAMLVGMKYLNPIEQLKQELAAQQQQQHLK